MTATELLDRLDVQDTISRYHEAASLRDWDRLLASVVAGAPALVAARSGVG